MPFVPSRVTNQERKRNTPAPPSQKPARRQSEESLQQLFGRLGELGQYLRAADIPLMSEDDVGEYRPQQPSYYGQDGVQNATREASKAPDELRGARRPAESSPGLHRAIFG